MSQPAFSGAMDFLAELQSIMESKGSLTKQCLQKIIRESTTTRENMAARIALENFSKLAGLRYSVGRRKMRKGQQGFITRPDLNFAEDMIERRLLSCVARSKMFDSFVAAFGFGIGIPCLMNGLPTSAYLISSDPFGVFAARGGLIAIGTIFVWLALYMSYRVFHEYVTISEFSTKFTNSVNEWVLREVLPADS